MLANSWAALVAVYWPDFPCLRHSSLPSLISIIAAVIIANVVYVVRIRGAPFDGLVLPQSGTRRTIYLAIVVILILYGFPYHTATHTNNT